MLPHQTLSKTGDKGQTQVQAKHHPRYNIANKFQQNKFKAKKHENINGRGGG